MLGVFFLISQFSVVEIVLNEIFKAHLRYRFFKPIDDIERYLTIWPCSGLIYAFSKIFFIAESVTRVIYTWRIFPHNKIVPN